MLISGKILNEIEYISGKAIRKNKKSLILNNKDTYTVRLLGLLGSSLILTNFESEKNIEKIIFFPKENIYFLNGRL